MTAYQVLQGHAVDILLQLPAQHFHACVTSPPYWNQRAYKTPPQTWGGRPDCPHAWGDELERRGPAGGQGAGGLGAKRAARAARPRSTRPGMGRRCSSCGAWLGELGHEPTPDLYAEHMVEVGRAVRRVLRGDGTWWLNLGDTYSSRPNGSVGTNDNRGLLGSRNNHAAYRQANALRKGGPPAGLKHKDLVGIPWRVAFALQADGWYLRSDVVWWKPNPMPESVDDRPTKAHEYLFLLSKRARYYYDGAAIQEPLAGGAEGGKNARSVWRLPAQPYHGAHFATMPPDLAARCVRASSAAAGCCASCGKPWRRKVTRRAPTRREAASGGDRLAGPWAPGCACGAPAVPCRVLDPFAGSGSAMVAAYRLGREAVGIELQAGYVPMIERRICAESWTAGKGSRAQDAESAGAV